MVALDALVANIKKKRQIMKKLLSEAQQISPDFKLTPELEIDRKLVDWMNRSQRRGITIQDTLLCNLLKITKQQYWQSVARLHYLGVIRFPVEIFQK